MLYMLNIQAVISHYVPKRIKIKTSVTISYSLQFIHLFIDVQKN